MSQLQILTRRFAINELSIMNFSIIFKYLIGTCILFETAVDHSQQKFRIIVESKEIGLHKKFTDLGIDICNDEWFYVHINNYGGKYTFYKCDQLDGLIDCLKQKVNW